MRAQWANDYWSKRAENTFRRRQIQRGDLGSPVAIKYRLKASNCNGSQSRAGRVRQTKQRRYTMFGMEHLLTYPVVAEIRFILFGGCMSQIVQRPPLFKWSPCSPVSFEILLRRRLRRIHWRRNDLKISESMVQNIFSGTENLNLWELKIQS